ncbi:MAG: HD domain-containing protein [Nitrospirota bacterium]|nr:HD domain-containing protein [Nitrospirota bacterium]
MLKRDLEAFKDWFSGYTQGFFTDNTEDRRNIDLKIRHTFLVCENIVGIAQSESLNKNELLLAETAALFHDIGRFLQYEMYRTFLDSISVNHARLGAEILVEKNVLSRIPVNEQELILNTVRFHNTFELPSLADLQKILFLRLIRDADKIDIWRVFSEYYEAAEEDRASAAGLGLPDDPGYSRNVLSCLYKKTSASLSDLKTLNDFKLMQLSWAYGLNFRHSFRLTSERNFIRRISSTLPQTEEITEAVALLKEFVDEKAGGAMNEGN